MRCGIPVHLLGTRAEVGSLVETGSGMSGLPQGMQGGEERKKKKKKKKPEREQEGVTGRRK